MNLLQSISLAIFWKSLKIEFDIADAGRKAIGFAKKSNYALIFMDIGLPDTNGFEVTQEIRKNI